MSSRAKGKAAEAKSARRKGQRSIDDAYQVVKQYVVPALTEPTPPGDALTSSPAWARGRAEAIRQHERNAE
jgi:hypothetical protein